MTAARLTYVITEHRPDGEQTVARVRLRTDAREILDVLANTVPDWAYLHLSSASEGLIDSVQGRAEGIRPPASGVSFDRRG